MQFSALIQILSLNSIYLFISMFRCKGRVALPNRMSFRKSAKGEGVIFNPKVSIANFGNFKQGFFDHEIDTK